MKLLGTVVFAGLLSISTVACAKDETPAVKVDAAKVTQVAEAKKEEPAKQPEFKTVCLDVQGKDGKPVMDPKTGKPKQNCTKVKVHQKFEGTKIPDGKK
jgi:hypothetical protein